jgi:cobalt-zinc-cadmium resistance protein CzcA
VVIGGLVTSTLLTLVVLPCLYIVFEKIRLKSTTVSKTVAIVFVLIASGFSSYAQAPKQVSIEEAINLAMQNNKGIQAASLEVDYYKQSRRTSSDIGKLNATMMLGQYNSYSRDNNITLTQSIPFPTVFSSQKALGNAMIEGGQLKKAATENELAYQVKQVCYYLLFLKGKEKVLISQDSVFQSFVKATDLRFRTGESRLLEKTTAETQRDEARNALALTRSDIIIYEDILATLTGNRVTVVGGNDIRKSLELPLDTIATSNNPQLRYLQHQIVVAEKERKVTGAKVLPDIVLGYFNQTLVGTLNSANEKATINNRFSGFMVGVSIPLWIAPHTARVKAARINEERSQKTFEYNQTLVAGQWQRAVQEYIKNKSSLDYYESSALENAALLLRHSDTAFRNGEIAYTEYWLSIRNAMQIRENYLNSINNLNQSIINLEFLAGIK